MIRILIALLLLAGVCRSVAARDHEDGFDGFKPSWIVKADPAQVRLLHQRRNRQVRHSGDASENVELETLVKSSRVELATPVPGSRILPDLTLSLWLKSNREGAQPGVRVVFPYQRNPRSDRAFTTLILGDPYTKVGSWEHLLVEEIDQKVRRELPRIRAQLLQVVSNPQEIDLRSPYVDRAVVVVPCSAGVAELFVDELRIGPIVDAEDKAAEIKTASATAASAPAESQDAEFRLDRLYVQGKPFFPRLIPYHGEKVPDLARSRFNLAWVPDVQDITLMTALQQQGLRVIATPPHPLGDDGQHLDENQASLAPFGGETAAVLFWLLGTQVSPEETSAVAGWADQVRNADRRFRRPLMIDVTGAESSFSRHASMLGVSRQPMNSPLPLKDYRDLLVERRHSAQPGTFFWTWIQTEPTPELVLSRPAESAVPILEPEQLRLQVYAALQAGCRGLGFWTQSSLDDSLPGALERKLMLAQLNMELELLEPWLATGTVHRHVQFRATLPGLGGTNQLALNFATGSKARKKLFELLSERDIQLRRQAQVGRELDAAILETEYGKLLLPVWLSETGQFVPDQMSANDATVVVPGVEETASAWEVSTTSIRSLDLQKKRVAGGIEIKLLKFDTTSAVLFTSDRSLVARLQKKMETLRQPSALACVELAEAKLARVTEVERELQALGFGQPDAGRILARAAAFARQARDQYGRQDFDGARLSSNDTLQLLRILQHACWHDALRYLYAPTCSPHTVCFQTLPDHWRLMARFDKSEPLGKSLLAGGDFEDFEDVVAQGWTRDQIPIDGVRSTAELTARPHKGQFALRLAAVPAAGDEAPGVIAQHPITVRSPQLKVRGGQILYVSGWVRVTAPTSGSREGAQLYDSLGGPSLALRWTQPTDWQQFGILREVRDDGEFQLTLTLSGYGDVLFDDLQVTALTPAAAPPLVQTSAPAPSRSSPLQMLQRLPGLGRGRESPP